MQILKKYGLKTPNGGKYFTGGYAVSIGELQKVNAAKADIDILPRTTGRVDKVFITSISGNVVTVKVYFMVVSGSTMTWTEYTSGGVALSAANIVVSVDGC